jgi:hypothetical protein
MYVDYQIIDSIFFVKTIGGAGAGLSIRVLLDLWKKKNTKFKITMMAAAAPFVFGVVYGIITATSPLQTLVYIGSLLIGIFLLGPPVAKKLMKLEDKS